MNSAALQPYLSCPRLVTRFLYGDARACAVNTRNKKDTTGEAR
jgi:hypothetical protein